MTHLWVATISMPPSRRSTKLSRYQAISPRYSRKRRRLGIERGKVQALVIVELRHRDEAPALALQFTVIGFLQIRHAGQPPVIAIGPAVIGAGKARGIAGIGAAQPVAAMAADIQKGVDLAARCRAPPGPGLRPYRS